jgi:hypothetical protein
MRWKLAAVMTIVLSASICAAQTPKSQTVVFAVKGSVVDKKGSPAGFAWVYLKETRSRILRIKRAGHDGHFSFPSLNVHFDYEIYAERENLVSEKVLVSGTQKAPDVIVNLKLNGNQESK